MTKSPYRFPLFFFSLLISVVLFTKLPNLPEGTTSSDEPASSVSSKLTHPIYNQFFPAIINPGRSFAQTSIQPVYPLTATVAPTLSPTPFQPSTAGASQPGAGTKAASTVQAAIPGPAISEAFQGFIESIVDGEQKIVRGLYVDGVLALRVVQQPTNEPLFVSEEAGTATQFQNAGKKGITGLLAHNFLSGELFFNLERGQEVDAVYGDGRIARYRVSEILNFQKLKPSSPTSDFIDLATNERQTSGQVFARVYSGEPHLTLQTCLRKDDNWSWGLLFVVATPIK